MLSELRDGFVGLFLVLGHWLAPVDERPELRADLGVLDHGRREVQCAISMAWNNELEALIDAGIPLRFRFMGVSDAGDSVSIIRSLRCDVVTMTYCFGDTAPISGANSISKKYPQVLMALRDFSRWSFTISADAGTCRIEADILPSTASRLNRTVDMSAIWGQKKLTKVLVIKE
jgi:hypothetical protein